MNSLVNIILLFWVKLTGFAFIAFEKAIILTITGANMWYTKVEFRHGRRKADDKEGASGASGKAAEGKPFLTDEELAANFNVSIQTIRLDRLALVYLRSARGSSLLLRRHTAESGPCRRGK